MKMKTAPDKRSVLNSQVLFIGTVERLILIPNTWDEHSFESVLDLSDERLNLKERKNGEVCYDHVYLPRSNRILSQSPFASLPKAFM